MLYGVVSYKIKNVWYLGEACTWELLPDPSLKWADVLRPSACCGSRNRAWPHRIQFHRLDALGFCRARPAECHHPGKPRRRHNRSPSRRSFVQGVCRLVIGVQLVIAGFQLPAKYQLMRWKEMAICLLPVMTIMWLCTTACVLATIPKLTLVSETAISRCSSNPPH